MEKPHLTSSRLYLRLGELADIPEIIAFNKKNDSSHLAPWNPEIPKDAYQYEHWEKRIQSALREFYDDQSLRLFIFLKTNDQLIGSANFTGFERGPFQNCRLGYKIDEDYQNQGLMTEALELAITYIFNTLNLHRIEANYIPRNKRSGRVLEKLGFMEHGTAPQYLKIAGHWQDHTLTSLINPDYQEN